MSKLIRIRNWFILAFLIWLLAIVVIGGAMLVTYIVVNGGI